MENNPIWLLIFGQDDEIFEDNEGISNLNDKTKLNNKKGKKLHTIYSKLKIISYAKANSRRLAIEKFNIPEQTLSDWFKNENKFIEALNKNVTSLHKGRELFNEEGRNGKKINISYWI